MEHSCSCRKRQKIMEEESWDVVSGLQLYEDYKIATRDRLSELPNSLILSVLSLLMETRDVVKTSLLAKRWNNLWTSVPCLDFSWFSDDPRSRRYLPELDSFKNFINKALAHWKGTKILYFNLSFVFHKSVSTDVDSWLIFAIEKQVEELHVNLCCFDSRLYSGDYYLPQRIYSCSSITKLSLTNCILRIDGERVHWNRLKSLSIIGLRSLIEGDAMKKILSGAPRLEIISISRYFPINDDLSIESTCLKRLMICVIHLMSNEANNKTLRISAPNLEDLKILGVPYSKCLLNVPCLSNADLSFYHQDYYGEEMLRKNFRSICRAEKLTLSAWCIKVLVKLKKKGKAVEFSNAKILAFKVYQAHQILDVLEMFPKLTVLIVEFDTQSLLFVDYAWEYLFQNNAFLDLPLLRRVEITLPPTVTSIIRVAEILLKNAHVLEKMVFRLQRVYGGPTSFLAEEALLSMPRSSPTAEVVVIKDPA